MFNKKIFYFLFFISLIIINIDAKKVFIDEYKMSEFGFCKERPRKCICACTSISSIFRYWAENEIILGESCDAYGELYAKIPYLNSDGSGGPERLFQQLVYGFNEYLKKINNQDNWYTKGGSCEDPDKAWLYILENLSAAIDQVNNDNNRLEMSPLDRPGILYYNTGRRKLDSKGNMKKIFHAIVCYGIKIMKKNNGQLLIYYYIFDGKTGAKPKKPQAFKNKKKYYSTVFPIKKCK